MNGRARSHVERSPMRLTCLALGPRCLVHAPPLRRRQLVAAGAAPVTRISARSARLQRRNRPTAVHIRGHRCEYGEESALRGIGGHPPFEPDAAVRSTRSSPYLKQPFRRLTRARPRNEKPPPDAKSGAVPSTRCGGVSRRARRHPALRTMDERAAAPSRRKRAGVLLHEHVRRSWNKQNRPVNFGRWAGQERSIRPVTGSRSIWLLPCGRLAFVAVVVV